MGIFVFGVVGGMLFRAIGVSMLTLAAILLPYARSRTCAGCDVIRGHLL